MYILNTINTVNYFYSTARTVYIIYKKMAPNNTEMIMKLCLEYHLNLCKKETDRQLLLCYLINRISN